LHFCREELLNNRLAEYHSSRGIGSESLLLQESVTRMCDDIESMDEEPPMYEEALPSQEAPEQPAVDCENSGLIWVPPPPEDDEDEVGTSMVDDDEEDYDQNGEQSHQDLDYEYGSGIELDLGDFRHPKHNISNDSSLSLVCQTTQSDETFNRYPVGFLSK
jgi:hypothetical protein